MKKLIPLITLLILFCSFAYADINDTLSNIWPLSTNAADLKNSLGGRTANITDLGGAETRLAHNPVGSFVKQFNDNAERYMTDVIDLDRNITISWWAFYNTTNAVNSINYVPAGNDDALNIVPIANKFVLQFWNGGDSMSCGTTIPNQTWTHFLLVKNGTYAAFYQNGSLCIDKFMAAEATGTNTDNIDFGSAAGKSNMSYDEIYIWNRTLNITEINLLSTGTFYPFTITEDIDVTLLIPQDNIISNKNVENFTYNVSSNVAIANCSLWSNFSGTWKLNQTNTSLVINNSANQFAPVNLSDNVYVWNVNCTDITGSIGYLDDNNYTLTIDTTTPVLVTTFINNSVVYPRLKGQFNFTDENLMHSVNITIPTNNNFIVFNRSSIGDPSINVSINFDLSQISGGNQILMVEYSDGGTGKSIEDNYDFDVSLTKGNVKYNLPKGNYIKTSIQGSSIFDEWTSKYDGDKYIQIYEPNNPSATQTFIEESDSEIHIYENPGHHGGKWIVFGDYWKDYVLKDEPNAKLTITRITPYKVQVDISGITKHPGKLEFNSIGGVNKVAINYTFFSENVSETFDNPLFNFITTNLYLDFIGIGHSAPSNVILQWNNTNYSATQIQNDVSLARYIQSINVNISGLSSTQPNLNVTHQWFFNLTNATNTSLQNQTVSFVGIDNCSVYSVVAVNFTTRWDATDILINSTLNGYFEFDLNGTTHNFNVSKSVNTSHIICIFPNNAEYIMDAQIEYINESFNTETYYFRNATFNNVTQHIDLFFTNGTFVTFTVKDENDDAVSDVFINVLQYDFGTNTHRITEILRTDSGGEAIGTILLDTEWYKFILNKDLETVFESEPVKITTTSKTFRINLLTDFFEEFTKFRGIMADVSFTNSTRNFVYTFNNPTGNTVRACLNVKEVTAQSVSDMNESCITSSSGTILINVGNSTEVVDRHFLGRGFIQTDSSDPTTNFLADEDEANFVVGFRTYGSEGIFVSYLARMTIALIGIWSPVVAILGLVAIDVGMVWVGLYHMNIFVIWSYIIMAIIVIVKVSRR